MTDTVAFSGTQGARSRGGLYLLALGFRAHIPLFTIAFAIVGLETWAEVHFGIKSADGLAKTLLLCVFGGLPAIVVSVAVERVIHLIRVVKPDHPLPALGREMWRFLSDRKRLANGIPAYLALVVMICAFARLKPGIPTIQPFAWDQTFFQWDRALHFGADPWTLLQPVFGNPVMTIAIDAVYCLWFAVMYFAFTQFAFAKTFTLGRVRFFVAYFLVWSIGGMVLAAAFSSAGPVFYTLAGNATNPYAPLLAQLSQVGEIWPLFALKAQALLADSYQNSEAGMISGISAMPSLHNAIAALLAFVGWSIGRRIGWAAILFAFAILLGSVHLGWHYAIDGYAGIAIAAVLWWVSGPIARLLYRFQPSQEFKKALET